MYAHLIALAQNIEHATSREDIFLSIIEFEAALSPILSELSIPKRAAIPPALLERFDMGLKARLVEQAERASTAKHANVRVEIEMLQHVFVQVMEQFRVSSAEVARRQQTSHSSV